MYTASLRPRLGARALAAALVGATATALIVFSSAGPAPAATTSFTLSPVTVTPGSGPPGTVVHVSSNGCTPGLLSSPATDFVAVTAPTLAVAFRAPVTPNGSWQGTFTVPANAVGLPAAVVAVCTSAGLPSLFTIYTPQTFTVTGPRLPDPPTTLTAPVTTLPAPTSVIPPPPTVPVGLGPPPAPPTTAPPAGGGGQPAPTPTTRPTRPQPGPTTGTVPGTISIGVPGDTTLPVGAGPMGGGSQAGLSDGSGSGSASRTVSALATPRGNAAAVLPADLGTASLAAGSGRGSGGLGWVAWALLVAVLVGGAGAPALLRSRRQTRVAGPLKETT